MPFAVITGATQGLGKAITEKFLTHGYSVAICARNKNRLIEQKGMWEQEFPEAKILAMRADLSIAAEVMNFADEIKAEFPCVDVLVNNAGRFLPGNLSDEPEGLLESLMATNVFSAYHLTRALLSGMKERNKGHIFNMCSVASLRAYPNGGSYSMSKYALLGFSDNLRLELMPYAIKVTAISPGATYTPSWENTGVDPERLMQANDVADIIWSACNLSSSANIDHIVLRPVKGDL